MNEKSLSRMMRANATTLTISQLSNGLARWDKIIPNYETTVTHNKEKDHHFIRVQMWNKGRHFIVARTGITELETKAKIGLALPVKGWGLE